MLNLAGRLMDFFCRSASFFQLIQCNQQRVPGYRPARELPWRLHGHGRPGVQESTSARGGLFRFARVLGAERRRMDELGLGRVAARPTQKKMIVELRKQRLTTKQYLHGLNQGKVESCGPKPFPRNSLH
jgi:hypothetical protein